MVLRSRSFLDTRLLSTRLDFAAYMGMLPSGLESAPENNADGIEYICPDARTELGARRDRVIGSSGSLRPRPQPRDCTRSRDVG